MHISDIARESAAIELSKAGAIGSALITGLYSWLASINWGTALGIAIAVFSAAVNFIYLRRRDRREAALYAIKMKE